MVICANPHAHDPLHLQKTYFAHSFIDLSKFYCIRCAIWSFKKPLWCAKTIEWLPKILSSRMQTGHMCQPTCPWPPFTWRRHILLIPSSNGFFYIGCGIWTFTKPLWSEKTIDLHPKTLSSGMQTGHMCQPTCPWPPSFGEGISCSFFHQFE